LASSVNEIKFASYVRQNRLLLVANSHHLRFEPGPTYNSATDAVNARDKINIVHEQ